MNRSRTSADTLEQEGWWTLPQRILSVVLVVIMHSQDPDTPRAIFLENASRADVAVQSIRYRGYRSTRLAVRR